MLQRFKFEKNSMDSYLPDSNARIQSVCLNRIRIHLNKMDLYINSNPKDCSYLRICVGIQFFCGHSKYLVHLEVRGAVFHMFCKFYFLDIFCFDIKIFTCIYVLYSSWASIWLPLVQVQNTLSPKNFSYFLSLNDVLMSG